MDYAKKSLELHYEWKGKLEILPKMQVRDRLSLSLAYTPGVAAPCLEIEKDKAKSFELTNRSNTIAVVTDGSAVLGLGDIGPEAGMPVMEGKCVLFKAFAGVDAVPICLRTKDTDSIVETVSNIAGSFGGINLEDISAPRCFEIEERLKASLDIPVFHDDQHGTAIVVLAALTNALKLVNKEFKNIKVVINGAGAAGTAITKLLLSLGISDILVCARRGILCRSETWMSPPQRQLAELINAESIHGGLSDAVRGADVFIGVSAAGVLSGEMIKSMNRDAVVFALANPTPEIMPDLAKKAGARIIGTGRSDFPNQINNVLAFPGVFRGALDVRASDINEQMKLAAAGAIAALAEDALSEERVLPDAFDERVGPAVAAAVAKAARESGIARVAENGEPMSFR